MLSALRPITAEAFQPLQYGAHSHAGVNSRDKVCKAAECFLRNAGAECLLGASAGTVGATARDGNSQSDKMFLAIGEVLGGVCLFEGLDYVQFLRVHAPHPTTDSTPLQGLPKSTATHPRLDITKSGAARGGKAWSRLLFSSKTNFRIVFRPLEKLSDWSWRLFTLGRIGWFHLRVR